MIKNLTNAKKKNNNKKKKNSNYQNGCHTLGQIKRKRDTVQCAL